MSTILFFHAHPDDEASQTSGAMARAVSEGHRVVVVYATNGDHGDAPDDLAPGESVVDRRRAEAAGSAQVLGTARVAWLDYADSGMTGWEQNAGEKAFHGADLTEAGQRLADILDEEAPDVVVGYDWHGGYGHPDHVKVHPVMHRALELTRETPRLFESTMNRDRMRVMYRKAVEAGVYPEGEGFNPDQPMDDGNPLGLPEREISFYVDVTPWLENKRAALAAHASQSDARGILEMPDEVFPLAFGREHYVDVAAMEASGIPPLDGHAHGARPDGEPLPEGWFF
ncbi:MAG: GlcNAc-PI de-N-acetylase [Dermacoccus nishinomiyaensis]|nr:MAG: GlcNAc-PI de-N-acetylase [Dermacoccus nishinomiyaensis]